MKKLSGSWAAKILIILMLGTLLAPMLPVDTFAGGMPSTEPRVMIGPNSATGNGDYVSASGGLNTYYSFFIEVPAGTGNLVVDVYDAQMGSAIDHNNGSWSSNVTYTLRRPNGTTQQTRTCNAGASSTFCNTGWTNHSTVSSPAAGHWELRIQMTGSDWNFFAIRARDTSTNRELNMYARAFDVPGVWTTGNSNVFHLYPYITSGCGFTTYDFDYDSGGSLSFTSPSNTTTNFSAVSGNDVWSVNSVNSFTTDINAADYGIWAKNMTISVPSTISGNIVTNYVGNYASTYPPTAQPQANTFRIYMPTYNNGGTAGTPVKPYITQSLYWVSGPTTPVQGTTTRAKVVIRVINPTAYPITFNASNLVTANIPGGTVLYAGGAAAEQGTFTAPAVGGSGNITWNPGSVAAGTTAVIFSYDIDITPVTTGARTVVTGAASGTWAATTGTKASFLDETGVSAYQFGPLCELAFGTTTTPTLATLSSFSAYTAHGKVVVEWATSSEVNTAGFFLKRFDTGTGKYVTVNEKMVHTRFDGHRAGIYRLVDSGAASGAKQTYILTEVEAKGRMRDHGPFEVTPATRVNASPMHSYSSRQSVNAASAKGQPRWKKVGSPRFGIGNQIRMSITEEGIYYIDAARVARLLGMSAANTANMLKHNMFMLSNQGNSVAYMYDAQNSRIIFYGQGINTNFSSENVYWLTLGRGVAMQSEGSGVQPADSPAAFIYTKHFEEKHVDAAFLGTDANGNYWYWDYVIGGYAELEQRSLNLTASGIVSGTSANIYVKLAGQSTVSQIQFALNGQVIGSGSMGIENKTFSLSVPAGILKEGANTLDIKGMADSMFFIEAVDLAYTKYYTAEGNSLTFPGASGNMTVTGFGDSGIKVFDITEPLKPKSVNITVKNNSAGFSVADSSGKFIAVSAGAIKSITNAYGTNGLSKYRNMSGADYVVITTDELKSSVQPLADYRRSLGLTPIVVTVSEIMDDFNYGIYDPAAIKSFLAYAYNNWSKKPKYVLLAGSGTYDYRDYLEYGGQQVPPAMVSSPDGLIPSDNYYADINGDHIPEIAIGRLPATTAAELAGMVSKIITYEKSAAGDWANKALMVADITDDAGDFNNANDEVVGLFPAKITVNKLYYSNMAGSNDMNAALLQGIRDGAVFINYFGHAGIDRLSLDGILQTGDVAGMTNIGKLPVMTAMTCLMGNFAFPGFTTLGETLMLKQDGGVAALWTSTGFSENKKAVLLDRAFYGAAFGGGVRTLGDIVISAIKGAKLVKDDQYLVDSYIILGDPALRIKGLKATDTTPSKGRSKT